MKRQIESTSPVADTQNLMAGGDNPDQLLLDFTEHGKADYSETGWAGGAVNYEVYAPRPKQEVEMLSHAKQYLTQIEAENARLRALVSTAVEMLTFEYTAGDGVPEKFSAEWDLLLRQAQEGRG